jgi:integrase
VFDPFGARLGDQAERRQRRGPAGRVAQKPAQRYVTPTRDLRHTHISHLLAAGVHPKIASERAGHSSVAITLDANSHVIPGMQEDAAKKIDAALRTHLERTPA